MQIAASALHPVPAPPTGGVVEASALRADRFVVIARALNEREWDLVRAFVNRVDRDDLRLRFGRLIDFGDEATLRRFFDVEAGTAEIAWLMDKTSAIAGIVERIAVSSSEAEIALLVRSDLKRRGIGEFLLRQILARAFRQRFRTASATIYRDNRAMLRLAAKVGYVIRKSSAFAIDLTFDAAAAGTARLPPAMDGQPAFRRSAG